MNIARAAFAGPLVVLALAPAEAARAEAAEDGDIVVTAQREHAERKVEAVPGGAAVVPAEAFANRVAVSLRDALAFTPGVHAQPRFGQEIRLSVRGSGISRGFHLRGLTLLQDGIPINLADDNGDFQELDPLIFDHIEVYRGANALRFGGTTLGGGINGVTPTGRSSPGAALRLDGGSFDTVRGKAAYGWSGERLDLWLAATADRSEGDRQHSDRRSLRAHGNVGVRLAENVETRFYASGQTIDQELPGALPYALALDGPQTGNAFGDQQRDVDSLRLQNRTTIGLGASTLEAGAFLNLKHLFHPIFQLVDQRSTDWGLFARLSREAGPVQVTIGSTARFGTVDSRRYVNVDGHGGALTFEADQEARTIDLYGELRYRLGPVSLIAGGIYTHGMREQDQLYPVRTIGRARFSQFSPRFGLLWQAAEGVQAYANFSRSHELPGFIELAQIASFVPLDAQHAWTGEAGVRGRIGIARFDISLYRARVQNELLQFTIGPDVPASTFNAGRTLHQGVEAGLDLAPAPWLRLRQVYTYSDFRFRGDPAYGDNRLPVVPKHLYRAELRLGTERLNVAPSAEYVPSGAWADYRNSLRVKGYVSFGATAEAEVRAGMTLFLDARNLGKESAIGDISAAVAATPASAIFYPIERRAVYGGIRARF